MKKQPFSILFTITLLFIGFIAGFLLGRGYGDADVLVSVPEAILTQPAQQETLPPTVSFPIDLNRADKDALMALPGIGETLALRILAFRRERGRFHSITDLIQIDGITESTIETLQGLVFVGG